MKRRDIYNKQNAKDEYYKTLLKPRKSSNNNYLKYTKNINDLYKGNLRGNIIPFSKKSLFFQKIVMAET